MFHRLQGKSIISKNSQVFSSVDLNIDMIGEDSQRGRTKKPVSIFFFGQRLSSCSFAICTSVELNHMDTMIGQVPILLNVIYNKLKKK